MFRSHQNVNVCCVGIKAWGDFTLIKTDADFNQYFTIEQDNIDGGKLNITSLLNISTKFEIFYIG